MQRYMLGYRSIILDNFTFVVIRNTPRVPLWIQIKTMWSVNSRWLQLRDLTGVLDDLNGALGSKFFNGNGDVNEHIVIVVVNENER